MQAVKDRLCGGLAGVARIGGQCRAVWSLVLAETCDRYKAEGKFAFYAEMSARLPKLLRDDPRLAGLPRRAAQMTVQRPDRALKDRALRTAPRARATPAGVSRASRSTPTGRTRCTRRPGRWSIPTKASPPQS